MEIKIIVNGEEIVLEGAYNVLFYKDFNGIVREKMAELYSNELNYQDETN